MEFTMPGMFLNGEVRDDRRAVHEVVRGGGYGHVLWTTEFQGIVGTVLTISSSLEDTQQLEFTNGAAWTWQLPLEPDDPEAEKRELLACSRKLTRAQDKITVFVVDESAIEQPTPNPQMEVLRIL